VCISYYLENANPKHVLISGLGYYRIQNQFTQSYVSANSSALVTSSYGVYGKSASDWRIFALSNGFYNIMSMSTLQYISCTSAGGKFEPSLISTININDPSSCWMLLPVKDGLLIQNVHSRTNLTTPHGSANDGVVQELLQGAGKSKPSPIPWQVFNFERVDSPSPAFNDLGSDKVIC
jgi:hypothetical protein